MRVWCWFAELSFEFFKRITITFPCRFNDTMTWNCLYRGCDHSDFQVDWWVCALLTLKEVGTPLFILAVHWAFNKHLLKQKINQIPSKGMCLCVEERNVVWNDYKYDYTVTLLFLSLVDSLGVERRELHHPTSLSLWNWSNAVLYLNKEQNACCYLPGGLLEVYLPSSEDLSLSFVSNTNIFTVGEFVSNERSGEGTGET
jgi:hypothetical protein